MRKVFTAFLIIVFSQNLKAQTYLPAAGGVYRTLFSRGEPHTYGVAFSNSSATNAHTWLMGAGIYNQTYQGLSIFDETSGVFPLRIMDNSSVILNGYVGIGIANPWGLLSLNDATNSQTKQLSFGFSGTETHAMGRNSYTGVFDFNALTNNNGFRFLSSAPNAHGNFIVTNMNAGIGTDNPYSKLMVSGGEFMLDYTTGGATNGAAMRIATNANQSFMMSNAYWNGAGKYARAGGSSYINFDITSSVNAGDISFHTAPAGVADQVVGFNERMRLTQAGSLGVGINSPTAVIHAYGSSGDAEIKIDASGANKSLIGLANAGTDYGQLYFDNTNNNLVLFQKYHTGNLVLGTNSSAKLTINSSGNVGIGTSTPSTPLQVQHSTNGFEARFGASDNYHIDISGNQVQAFNSSAGSPLYLNYSYDNDIYTGNGNVGIGITETHGYKLAVNGSAVFKKVVVSTSSPWPDYVFHPSYKLQSLGEVEKYIQENKRLPEMPSAADVSEKGIDVGEVQAQLLKKIEELTLYVIEQQKTINAQGAMIKDIKQQLSKKK